MIAKYIGAITQTLTTIAEDRHNNLFNSHTYWILFIQVCFINLLVVMVLVVVAAVLLVVNFSW